MSGMYANCEECGAIEISLTPIDTPGCFAQVTIHEYWCQMDNAMHLSDVENVPLYLCTDDLPGLLSIYRDNAEHIVEDHNAGRRCGVHG